jgi:hypothetical protein
VCTAYPFLLAEIARRLRALANGEGRKRSADRPLSSSRCAVCEVRRTAEERAVERLVRSTAEHHVLQSGGLCVPHLRAVVERTDDSEMRRGLLEREAMWLERIAEDLQRYAVKLDGLRRALASEEESAAPYHALQILAGHRGVASGRPLRDEI